MKYYAVIDTNVLVSAMLKWDSILGNILELAFRCWTLSSGIWTNKFGNTKHSL